MNSTAVYCRGGEWPKCKGKMLSEYPVRIREVCRYDTHCDLRRRSRAHSACFQASGPLSARPGEHIDLILQCGDMGIFPDLSRMDKATVRHAEADDTEVGFLEHFASPNPEAEAVLSRTDCNLICVRGNHEDHAFLDRLEAESHDAVFPVDCYRRVYVLKTGVMYNAVFHEVAWQCSALVASVRQSGKRMRRR